MVHDPQDTQETPQGQGGERIAKAMARAGVASRREVERLIEAGRVYLNGVQVTTPATKVEPDDVLTVDGALVQAAEPARLFRYHKPVGLVTSHKDPQGRPTVFDALPKTLPRLISVGRLDLNSEGLLLLTNDGALARALELPASAIVRRYRARARGRVTQEKLDSLKNGVTVEGVSYGAIEAHLDKAKEGPQGANVWITVTLAEGKNREVRRVLEALGLTVNRLIRMSYGPLALGTLGVGEIEEVGPRVIREQFADHIPPGNLPTADRAQFSKPIATRAGGDVPRRGRTAPGAGAGPDDGMPKAKAVYKAGWAKPKIAPSPHPKRKAKAKPAAPEGQVRPTAIPPRAPRPESGLAAPRAPVELRAPRRDGPRMEAPRPAAPRPEAPRADAPRTKAPRSQARLAAQRPSAAGPRSEALRPDRSPRPDAPRPHGPRPNAAAAEARPARGPKADARRPDRFKGPEAAARDAKFRAEAEPKRSGSPSAPGRPSGPRGPKPSPSRPRSSTVRPPGPAPKGGPKRRG
ncbi:pseudouridine synthase [Phenylobacterium sp.]|uniref:pseudouridine synthase n=1 Tax=Phenylobacterium sp. TaxID=1871053 RepID=UPI003BAC5139